MDDLQEVRRYWPMAKYDGKNAYDNRVYRCPRSGLLAVEVRDGWRVAAGPTCATIAEAMRAAGFGVRAQGLRQVMNSLKRNDCAGRILPGPRIKPHKWFVELQSCQRPRKGARLGKRKREVPDEP